VAKRTGMRPWKVYYRQQRTSHGKFIDDVMAESGAKAFCAAVESYKEWFRVSPEDLADFYVYEYQYQSSRSKHGWDSVGDLPRKYRYK